MYYLYLPAKQKHQFSLFMTLSIRSLLGALTTFSSQLACNVLCHNVHPGIEITGYSHTYIICHKLVYTGIPWGESFILIWTGCDLDRVFAFEEEQTTTITCTIDMSVLI